MKPSNILQKLNNIILTIPNNKLNHIFKVAKTCSAENQAHGNKIMIPYHLNS